jgi:NAD(P)-dependent dehydrogenase (short-subunit alcohol dehydrogenase family)
VSKIAGKVAIVTGGSRGIGLAIAQRLASDGARVCITGRREDSLDEALAWFDAGTAIARAGKADDPVHRSDVFDAVAQNYGRLDILINNAGINPFYGRLMDMDLDVARKILDTNLLGTLAWTQAAYQHEGLGFASHGGAVVNLSSVTGDVASRGIGMYGISKAAVSHLTRTLAVELAPEIRVNAVSPAVVKTRFSKALYEDDEENVTARYPMARLGTPEDVAQAVAFLVSDEASWVTGQVLTLDGGLLAAGGTA